MGVEGIAVSVFVLGLIDRFYGQRFYWRCMIFSPVPFVLICVGY
jgi:hypothetical protein